MTLERASSNLPLWPFLMADAIFLAVAWLLFHLSHRPLLFWEAGLLILCVAAAAGSILLPFLRQNANDQALVQARALADAVRQIQKLELLAAQIGNATAQWQGVQEHATQTADTAKELAASMAAEAKAFTDFLQKANDSEKAHLRLEVEKLRRAEAEWLQILMRILDHVFALFQAAMHSGQANLIEQIGHFQNACRDAARRAGLAPTVANPGETFDPELHQLFDGEPVPTEARAIADTIATGYTYQGQLIRRPVVALQTANTPKAKEGE